MDEESKWLKDAHIQLDNGSLTLQEIDEINSIQGTLFKENSNLLKSFKYNASKYKASCTLRNIMRQNNTEGLQKFLEIYIKYNESKLENHEFIDLTELINSEFFASLPNDMKTQIYSLQMNFLFSSTAITINETYGADQIVDKMDKALTKFNEQLSNDNTKREFLETATTMAAISYYLMSTSENKQQDEKRVKQLYPDIVIIYEKNELNENKTVLLSIHVFANILVENNNLFEYELAEIKYNLTKSDDGLKFLEHATNIRIKKHNTQNKIHKLLENVRVGIEIKKSIFSSRYTLNLSREQSQSIASYYIVEYGLTAFDSRGQFNFRGFQKWLHQSESPELINLAKNLTKRHFEGICLSYEEEKYKITFPKSKTGILDRSNIAAVILSRALQEKFSMQQMVFEYFQTQLPAMNPEEIKQLIATMSHDELECAAKIIEIYKSPDCPVCNTDNGIGTQDYRNYMLNNGGRELMKNLYRPHKETNVNAQRITAKEFMNNYGERFKATIDMLHIADTNPSEPNMLDNNDDGVITSKLLTIFNIVGVDYYEKIMIVHPVISYLTTTAQSENFVTELNEMSGEANCVSAQKNFNKVIATYEYCQEAMNKQPEIKNQLLEIYQTTNFEITGDDGACRNGICL